MHVDEPSCVHMTIADSSKHEDSRGTLAKSVCLYPAHPSAGHPLVSGEAVGLRPAAAEVAHSRARRAFGAWRCPGL